MEWFEICVVLLASHITGDFILQTEWQAVNKQGGLGRSPLARRALAAHTLTYLAAYIPAFIWLAGEHGAGVVALAAVAIIVPHAIQDDARLLRVYARRVKGMEPDTYPVVMLLLDQSFHFVALFMLALALGS